MKKRVLSPLLVLLMVVSLRHRAHWRQINGHTAKWGQGWVQSPLARRSTMTEFMAPSV